MGSVKRIETGRMIGSFIGATIDRRPTYGNVIGDNQGALQALIREHCKRCGAVVWMSEPPHICEREDDVLL